jgi:hypothetical protein
MMYLTQARHSRTDVCLGLTASYLAIVFIVTLFAALANEIS